MSFSQKETGLFSQNLKKESDKFGQGALSFNSIQENLNISNLFNNINKLENSKKRLSFLLREIDLCVNRS